MVIRIKKLGSLLGVLVFLCLGFLAHGQTQNLSFVKAAPVAGPPLAEKLVLNDLTECGTSGSNLCTSGTEYKKFNLVYRIRIVDPFQGIYTPGRHAYSVTLNLRSQFVNCLNVSNIIDMSPAPGLQTSATVTLGGNGVADPVTEATITIPMEEGVDFYNQASAGQPSLKGNYISTTVPSLVATGITVQYVEIRGEIEEVESKRAFATTGQTVSLIKPVAIPGSNKVKFSWSGCPDRTYQLQLLKMYNNDPTKTTETDIMVDYGDFHYYDNKHIWNESFMINVNGTTKDLTLPNGNGFYIWRVRGLNDQESGGEGNPNNWGPWSAMYPPFLTSVPINITQANIASENSIFYYNQFDDDKNWVYSRSFIEGQSLRTLSEHKETIIGESISYVNGLGMVKQSQKMNNHYNESIANETFQDYVGRDVLHTLAAPTGRSYLGFVDNFNAGYNPDDFDIATTRKDPNPLPANSVVSTYYSDLNTDVNVPNADGYAFSRVRFDRSSLSEVIETSKAGDVLRINSTSSRTDRMFIGDVADIELVRVFGSEAPRPEHVIKKVTIDGNQTVNVAYIEKTGKTIATCLSLPTAQNLEPLASATNLAPVQISHKLIGGSPSAVPNEVVSSKVLVFAKPTTTLNFNYKLEQKTIDYLCNTECKSCDYEVEFKLVDADDPQGSVWANSVTIDPTNLPCEDVPVGLGGVDFDDPGNVSVTIPAGKYILTKRVKLKNLNGNTTLKYIDVYVNDLLQTIDANIYSTTANWVVCDALGAPITSLPNISVGDLNTKLSNQLLKGPNGVYAMLGINATSPNLETRIIKLDPYISGASEGTGCDMELVFHITPCEEVTCPEPNVFANDLIDYFSQEITAYNSASPAPCTTLSTTLTDHFIIYNEAYKLDVGGGQNLALTGPDMVTVIENMIYDHNNQNVADDVGKNFACENIKKAWELAVEAYLDREKDKCQNASSVTATITNDFLDFFFTFIGYRLIGSTDVAVGSSSSPGYKTHPYRCFYFPAPASGTPTLNAVSAASTMMSVNILNGNSINNALMPSPCNNLALPANNNDVANYIDPNWNILTLPFANACDKSEEVIETFFKGIRYALNTNITASFALPTNGTYAEILAMTQENERICRSLCDGKRDAVKLSIQDEFLSPELQSAAVGIVENRNGTLMGYNGNDPKIPARDNISANWIGTYTEMAVDHCKSKCKLTVISSKCPGTKCKVEGIGTPEEQIEFIKATTMRAKVYLTAAFEDVIPAVTMPAYNNWMSLYQPACEVCSSMDGGPMSSRDCNDHRYVEGNTLSQNPLPNIDGFLYRSCCPKLHEEHEYAAYPMEHIDFHQDPQYSNMLRYSPDRVTGVAYDLVPWLTNLVNKQINTGPSSGIMNIYEDTYNYINPVSDELGGVSPIAHVFTADNNGSGSKQLESENVFGGKTKNITFNPAGFSFSIGEPTTEVKTATMNGSVFTIERTHTSHLAMHGFMRVGIKVIPPTGYSGTTEFMYKETLQEYSSSGNKVYFTSDYPREDLVTGQDHFFARKFTPLNSDPIEFEYFVRIKKDNFLPQGTNDINNYDLKTISGALTAQDDYLVYYAASEIGLVNQPPVVGWEWYVNIPCLREYDENVAPLTQPRASITQLSGEDDIQNAYTVTPSSIVAGSNPPDMSVNKYVQVVPLYYTFMNYDDAGNPTDEETVLLWSLNNHKVFQPMSICVQYIPDEMPYEFEEIGPKSCNDALAMSLLSDLSNQVDQIKKDEEHELRMKYDATCGIDGLNDEFEASYEEGLHHYTLFYYNRAGNLIRTVPPKGVERAASFATDRSAPQVYPLTTKYDYNSYDEVIKSISPDGGETHYIYDNAGRLRCSQDARQLAMSPPRISFTRYDDLGRVNSTGEMEYSGVFSSLQGLVNADNMWPSVTTNNVHNIVNSYYGVTTNGTTNYMGVGPSQRNIRNRVQSLWSISSIIGGTISDDHSTQRYSYDLAGNVEWIGEDFGTVSDKPYTFIKYEYDQISGSVNKVLYDEGAADAMYHRYEYDENKKIVRVETSQDNKTWMEDAVYTYYKHGPLKATDLGDTKLQTLDYAYTINGWLKGMNHPSLLKSLNHSGASTHSLDDKFGFKIQYFEDDFKRSGSPFSYNESTASFAPTDQLYNGNIAAIMASNVSSLQTGNASLDATRYHVNDYRYDELNRLIRSSYGTRGAGNVYTIMSNDSYQEDFVYDANGNLEQAQRYDYNTVTPTLIDNFTYTINNPDDNNQLDQLADVGIDVSAYRDIKNTSSGLNLYTYDPVGNLIEDSKENLLITWNGMGKVETVQKNIPTGYTNHYFYNAQGNRIAVKKVETATGDISWTYYSRDINGKTMAIYNRDITASSFDCVERPIYGSSRLGVQVASIATQRTGSYMDVLPLTSYVSDAVLGQKRYQLEDHLGNVRNVISDMRLTTMAYLPFLTHKYIFYNPTTEDKAIYNYYAFGMPKTSDYDYKQATTDAFRYGFNGQERSDEIAGLGNHNTAKFWEYDTRLGRRWNIDPKPSAGISPYAAFANNPILFPDPYGDTIRINAIDKEANNGAGGPLRLTYLQKGKEGAGFYTDEGDKYSGDDKFVGEVAKALGKLESKSKGNELVTDLSNRTVDVVIEQAMETLADDNSVGYNPKDNMSGFDTEDSRVSKNWLNLGHELAHVKSYLDKRPGRLESWSGKEILQDEKYASHYENMIRKEHGLPLRTHYAVIEGPKGKMSPDPSTKILIKNTHSKFFKQTNFGRVLRMDRHGNIQTRFQRQEVPYKY